MRRAVLIFTVALVVAASLVPTTVAHAAIDFTKLIAGRSITGGRSGFVTHDRRGVQWFVYPDRSGRAWGWEGGGSPYWWYPIEIHGRIVERSHGLTNVSPRLRSYGVGASRQRFLEIDGKTGEVDGKLVDWSDASCYEKPDTRSRVVIRRLADGRTRFYARKGVYREWLPRYIPGGAWRPRAGRDYTFTDGDHQLEVRDTATRRFLGYALVDVAAPDRVIDLNGDTLIEASELSTSVATVRQEAASAVGLQPSFVESLAADTASVETLIKRQSIAEAYERVIQIRADLAFAQGQAAESAAAARAVANRRARTLYAGLGLAGTAVLGVVLLVVLPRRSRRRPAVHTEAEAESNGAREPDGEVDG